MATMRDFLDNMAAPVRNRSAVRLALHNPNARSASDIAGVERTARTLGMGYGLADAGGQDAALEARAREIEQNPVADAWTAKDEENIAFLNEDQQALADVYDSLVASGILHEADADRETVINASGAGDDVAAAWKRGVIQNRIAGYGLQFQRGEYENLDELRANILAAQKELEALRGNASDALGIYGAIEQLPRMIGYDAQYAGAGALVGGTIGSAVPGIGTLAGAGVGGAMGMAYTAANSEQGSFAADLLVQKDDAGNYLDPAAVQKAASLYGLLSGAVEVGGDALMFKLFKPVGGTIREAFSRRAARDAIREAAANRSLWPALRAFAGGAGKAAAVEGAQEFAQEGISTQIEATAKNLLSDAGANYYREQQAGAFSREGLSRMLEAGMAAAKTGPWFYAIPGGIRLTLDTRSALRAREFAEAHKELADKVAATRTRELSPARMESYLQTAGLDGDVLIPADAAWELQRKGTDLAGPLGWDVRDMEESAALGHDLVMPAARLQALLPPEQMKAVADIMRESPYAKSSIEATNLNEDLPADMDGLIEQAEDDALERSAIEGELERLREEMTQAVASAPHLVGQITSNMDAETSVGQYVDAQLGLIVRRARELTRMGIPMSDTLSRFSFRGLVKDEHGRMVTPEEADALTQRNAEEEALAPFWDAVWGRLNPDSLRVDFPDARRELAYQHGRGLFARKGEGLAVDELADELKNRGLLEEDADSSTLIERLKDMQRPERRTRGQRKTDSVSLLQTPMKNNVAYPDNGTPVGQVTPEIAATLKMNKPGTIVLDDVGLQHIEEQHGQQIKERGFTSIEDFIQYVLNNFDAVYEGKNNNSYEIVCRDQEPFKKITIKLQFERIGEFYRISNAQFIRSGSFKKRTPLWEKAPTSHSEKEPYRAYRGQSGGSERIDSTGPDGNPLFQSAWHGTPHRFDEFSLDAIGSGEGAQAHGWGLYFAGDRKVSEGYKNRLTDRFSFSYKGVKGEHLKPSSEETQAIRAVLKDFHDGKASDLAEAYNGQIQEQEKILADEHAAEWQKNMASDRLAALKDLDINQLIVNTGQLFEVDIPENDVLLDEQKKFSEQPENVRKAIEKLFLEHPEINFTDADGNDRLFFIRDMNEYTGAGIYRLISNRLSYQGGGNSDMAASRLLNEYGIKGITYEGGRDGRCFVVFDDKAIKVLDKYYQMQNTALGSTMPDADGNYVIQLFRGANLSTLTHETAHVFFLEMERLERERLADERMLADLAALREWTAAMDDDAAFRAEYDRYQKHAAYGGTEFDALPDYLKEDARNRAKQEMLARGFEQYLREGKAPSRKLEGVFTRFRKWLMRVYRDALDLHVELTDEVRDVFDRMLAHEEEMDLRAEAADVREETARLLDNLELKGAKRLEIEGLITAAKNEAAERLRHARDANRLKQRRAWAKEAREQMEREQVYVTRKAIRRTPIDLASFNDVNGEELGKALVRKLPGAATLREGGVEPEVFAAEQGYESAAAMARDIINSPTPGERVKQLVDSRQAEHDALFDADDYLFSQEQLAEQQERIAEALEAKIQHITAETRYRREVAGRTVGGEEIIPTLDDYEDYGSMARWLVGRDQLRAQARAVLDNRPMGEEVLPEQFRRAASRWMQEERRAILREDFGKALQANYRTRINIELARQAAERRETIQTLGKKAKKFVEMDKADSDARFAVLVLSQNIGLFNPTRKMLANAGDKGWENVEAFAARMREDGFMGTEDAFDRELFMTSRAWKGMNWGEFRPYAETMLMIMHMERESRTAETAQGRVELEARAKEIADSIYENNMHREPGALAKRNEAVELLKKFHAAHLKADTIALLLDGDTMGPAWRAIVQPINEATWKRAERLKRERDILKKLFSVYKRRELVDMKGKRFTVPGIPDAITKEQALSVLLNSGNAGNLRRLMAGQNLTEEQIQAIIDTLDERDVRFAQAVWDYFETFRKESFDLEESLTGVRPEAVEAQPVQTRFGLLRGGYYPVAYDKELSVKPVDMDRLGTQTGGMFPSVAHGSMKQRAGGAGLGTPLSLSLDVIPRHVAETVHMLTFRRPVTEVAKILRRKEVNGAIQETAGVAIAKALDGWLRYVAGERPARNGWDKAVSWARKNAALYTMGFKLSTMLAQVTGLLSTVAEIGPRWTLRGVVDSYGRGNPLDVYRTVMELSPMMRNRITSIDREVFEVSSRLMDTGSSSRLLDPFARMKSFMETHGFVPMGWVQMYFADLPTWNGAYAKALKENGGDIAEAVLYADAVVERTQVGGAEKDLAAVQRGRELGKLMTMFYSYFSALYNLSARRITMLNRRRDAASVYRLATLALLTWFGEPVLMGMLKGGPGEEEPDAEDWIVWGAKEAFFNPFNMVIGVREAASMVDSYVSGKGGRYRLSSALDVFDSFMRFGAQVGKAVEGDGDGKKLVLTGGKAVGQATGFINSQELLLLETFWDWLDGTSPELELGNLIRKKK